MAIRSRILLGMMVVIGALMVMILGLHWFGSTVFTYGLYSQLFGALLGGSMVLISVNTRLREGELVEPWLRKERLAWTLIGLGLIMWGIGESFWRYYLAQGQNPFPSWADLGYSSLPPLVFCGLLLQPSSDDSGRVRLLMVLDSLISMGSILAIAWFLLLGALAQAPGEANLAKFLGLYYPITDTALLSCVFLLLMRSQERVYQVRARQISLLIIGLGLCVFAMSDFIFNIQQNANAYVDGTWVDLGWPLGLMTIGVAAYLRRFIPATSGNLLEERIRRKEGQITFGPPQWVPYILLAILFVALGFNVLSTDHTQVSNRLVLLLATLCVVALVIIRQIITQVENQRLSLKQSKALRDLAEANARAELQARQIADYSKNLEDGIAHLKGIQTQLANGNLHARAHINTGTLAALAGSLNLMADRLVRFEKIDTHVQKLTQALGDLSHAFEKSQTSHQFSVPASCNEVPEIHRLLLSMGIKQTIASNNESRMLRGSSTATPRPNSGSPFSSSRSTSGSLAPSEIRARSTSSPQTPSQPGRPIPNSLTNTDQSDGPQMDFPSPPRWSGGQGD